MVFGSDYPVLPLGLTADSLDRFELPEAERAALNRGNALRLFPRFGSAAGRSRYPTRRKLSIGSRTVMVTCTCRGLPQSTCR